MPENTPCVADDRLGLHATSLEGMSLKMRLLSNLLTKFIQTGTLRVFDSGGRLHSFGGKVPGPTGRAAAS